MCVDKYLTVALCASPKYHCYLVRKTKDPFPPAEFQFRSARTEREKVEEHSLLLSFSDSQTAEWPTVDSAFCAKQAFIGLLIVVGRNPN